MELLEYNIRQLIFRNERQGLSPWVTQKFALDILKAIQALHANSFVHADLKPANIMWSAYDGAFKLLDFGLTFHTEEPDLHQVMVINNCIFACCLAYYLSVEKKLGPKDLNPNWKLLVNFLQNFLASSVHSDARQIQGHAWSSS